MGYKADSQFNFATKERERELLLAGMNYMEIAQITGVKHKTIAERNRIIHRVNIQAAFAQRIERDGIPNRLSVNDAFGYWFSGFFDGEGCFHVFSRIRRDYPERRLAAIVTIRNDDADVIHIIHDNLKVGHINYGKARGATHENITIRIEKIQDLAEVIIPFFETYPLKTKKAREFLIWKTLVRARYIATLGGYSQRTAASDEENAIFNNGVQAIRNIRTI